MPRWVDCLMRILWMLIKYVTEQRVRIGANVRVPCSCHNSHFSFTEYGSGQNKKIRLIIQWYWGTAYDVTSGTVVSEMRAQIERMYKIRSEPDNSSSFPPLIDSLISVIRKIIGVRVGFCQIRWSRECGERRRRSYDPASTQVPSPATQTWMGSDWVWISAADLHEKCGRFSEYRCISAHNSTPCWESTSM